MSDRRISEFNAPPVQTSTSELDASSKGGTEERVSVGSGEDRQSLVEGRTDSRQWVSLLTDSLITALGHFVSLVISPVTSFLIARAVDKAIERGDLHALVALVNEGASARKAGIGALLIAARDGNAVQTEKWLSLMKGAGVDLNSEITPEGTYLLNEALMRAVQANQLDVVCHVIDEFSSATGPLESQRLLGLMTWAISQSGEMNSKIDKRLGEARGAFKKLPSTLARGPHEDAKGAKSLADREEMRACSETIRELKTEREYARKIAGKLVEKFQSLGLDLTKNMQGRTLIGLATDVGSPGMLGALVTKITRAAGSESLEGRKKTFTHLTIEWENAIKRAEARANAKKNAALKGHWVDARHIPSKNVETLTRAILGLQEAWKLDQRTSVASMLSLKSIPDALHYEGKLSIANGLIKAGISVSADDRKNLKNWLPAAALHSAEGLIDFCVERDLTGLLDLFAKDAMADDGLAEKILERLWPEVDIQNTKALRDLAKAEGLLNMTALLSQRVQTQAFASVD